MVYIDNHINDHNLEEMLSQLPSWRRAEALRFRHESGRRQCAAAWLLLRHALHKEYGIDHVPPFIIGEHGKPALEGMPHIHFNLSHCIGAVACVVSSQPVGIDIEPEREAKESLLRYTMNDDEIDEVMKASNPNLAFTRLWTRKEALFKCIGSGISDNLKTILSTPGYHLLTKEVGQPPLVCTVCQMENVDIGFSLAYS